MRVLLVLVVVGLSVAGCGIKDDPLPVGTSV
jgi:predicted small lipoprotein YifL